MLCFAISARCMIGFGQNAFAVEYVSSGTTHYCEQCCKAHNQAIYIFGLLSMVGVHCYNVRSWGGLGEEPRT